MLTATFLASLLAISAAEGNAKTVKTIDGVPVSPGYANFYEQLSKDTSEVPKEISEALEYFVGQWKGQELSGGWPTKTTMRWSVRRAGKDLLVVSETKRTVTGKGEASSRTGKMLFGWDAKQKRVKQFSFEHRSPSLTEKCVSWQVKSPKKWGAVTFRGPMLDPGSIDEIALEKRGRNEFVIDFVFNMMWPTYGFRFVRVEPAKDAEEGGAGQ